MSVKLRNKVRYLIQLRKLQNFGYNENDYNSRILIFLQIITLIFLLIYYVVLLIITRPIYWLISEDPIRWIFDEEELTESQEKAIARAKKLKRLRRFKFFSSSSS